MLIAILIMCCLLVINTFFILATLLCLYGKFNEVIEKIEGPFKSFMTGLINGLKK